MLVLILFSHFRKKLENRFVTDLSLSIRHISSSYVSKFCFSPLKFYLICCFLVRSRIAKCLTNRFKLCIFFGKEYTFCLWIHVFTFAVSEILGNWRQQGFSIQCDLDSRVIVKVWRVNWTGLVAFRAQFFCRST